jgi:hypothetical protein
MTTIHFKLADSGDAVRDIQRKLASLDPDGDPDLIAFRAEPSTGIFDAATAKAICAFKKRNGEADPVGDCDEHTWRMLNDQAGSVFAETWQYEMDALRENKDPKTVQPVRDRQTQEAHRRQFAGLAFSGGGIRSATFNLGTLQALAELRMLRDFDYLSTVSGGGYIGAWFSKWLKRRDSSIVDIERELTPGSREQPKREAEEVKFLRQYTNYLTPKTGFFSADTWALLSTYTRNTMLNLTILALVLAAVMVLPRLLAWFVDNRDTIAWLVHAKALLGFSVFSGVAALMALWSVFWIAASISGQPDPGSKHRLWRQNQTSIISFVVLPLMVAALFGSVALWENHAPINTAWNALFAAPSVRNPIFVWLFAPGGCYFLAWSAGWLLARRHNQRLAEKGKALIRFTWKDFLARLAGWLPGRRQNKAVAEQQAVGDLTWKEARIEGGGHFLCAITALAVGTVLVVMTTSALHDWYMAPPAAKARPAPTATEAVSSAAQAVTSAAQAVTAAARGTPAAPQPVGAAAGTQAASAVPKLAPASTTVAVIAFGMPILLSLFGVTMVLCVGLVGRLYTDKSREWWSRQGGWTAIFVIAWIALITVSLYAPALVGYFYARFGELASVILGSAWLGTTVGGLMLGKSSATGAPNGKSRLDWLARAAPLVFSVGAVCLVSSMLHALLLPHKAAPLAGGDLPFIGFLAEYDRQTLTVNPVRLLLTLGGLVAISWLLAWRVDINKFSLHMMYRNRLVRAYLGASNTDRKPHPFTGFDPADDEHMDELLAPNTRLQRPFHIINTALNLVNGKELAWQTRKAANFTFTPAFCGFELPSMASPGGAQLAHEALRGGFRRTAAYRSSSTSASLRNDEERGINLGMAVSVSGAAASPSMGYHSSPPLAFLMTLFNVRLGRWFANPIRPIPGRKGNAILPPTPPRTSPPVGLWYLLRELFGLTDAKANFVYLSDGGHFENLGLYELVRRRCRLVVVVDAGADGQFNFEDLGNAIRKCATDLYVEIEIDVGRIDLLKPAEFSRSHCVTGTIRYDKVDHGAPVGTLLYIKPSLLGNEFADVLNYRKTNKTFPHQPTADQWFDETQFETYRSLGYNIGKIALAQAAAAAARNDLGRHDIASLCRALHASWDDPKAATEEVRNGEPLRQAENRRIAHRRQASAGPKTYSAATEERRMVDRRQA